MQWTGQGPALWVLIGLFVSGLACAPEAPSEDPGAHEARQGEEESPPAPPPPAVSELRRGIDVSVHSGTVDWSQVRAEGHHFAFVKATEGVDLKDPAFDGHWPALRQAGLLRGAYHFYVTEDDPEEMARFFIDNVELHPGDLAPVVDVELIGHGTKPGLSERLRTFLELLEAHYGVKPILYTSAEFWDEHVEGDFSDHPLWVAEYQVDEPVIPEGWDTWHLWQWKGDAEVPGVEKGADLTRVNREADLTKLFVPAPQPATSKPTGQDTPVPPTPQ